MPTIAQLPAAAAISAADQLPISQDGTARAISVGALFAAAQPVITVSSCSLLGRSSLGPGGPEQVNIGTGVSLLDGTLIADGVDHAGFPLTSGLSIGSNLVISDQGRPGLMPASLMRGLFSAGPNVAIDSNGVISATSVISGTGAAAPGSSISELQVVTGLAAQDLIAVSHSGSNSAIAYSNLLGGITIDQAQTASPAEDTDRIWVAQGTNIMAAQNFSSIWLWIANKLTTYRASIIEVTVDINLDVTVHNGRILICSQPVTLTPLVENMGTGFQCTVINVSNGIITLGSSFISSSGRLMLSAWQSAVLSCISYSGGTIAYADMRNAVSASLVSSQVINLSIVYVTATTITVSWEAPASGNAVSYILRFRLAGTTAWSTSVPVIGETIAQLASLAPATSYDIIVGALDTAGSGTQSAILIATTAVPIQASVPNQVNNVTATVLSNSDVQISWSAQTGAVAATGFTVQYKTTGLPAWTSSVTGIIGNIKTISGLQAATSYDFAVTGVNSAGGGPVSAAVSAVTLGTSGSVNLITWNLLPTGAVPRASGVIGVNARVGPAESPIQFGFSPSLTIPPSTWTAAVHINSDLWGAYAPTPSVADTWYTWAEGLDGSGLTVSSSSFQVQ